MISLKREVAQTRESETILGKTSVVYSPTAYPGIKVSQIGKGSHRRDTERNGQHDAE